MNPSKFSLNKIHFVGIGGIGMSGIAEVLFNLGYTVTGSDKEESDITNRLTDMGIEIAYNHSASNLKDVEMVVVSTAISEGNPEIKEAKKRSIPVLARAEMLSSLMNTKRGIAIAGTHGKTSTTSIVASIMTEAGLDPTFINGGIINSFNSNAQLGKGKYLIAEVKSNKINFSKFYNSVLSLRIAEEIDLDLDEPYIELILLSKDSTFIAKKAKCLMKREVLLKRHQ